MRLYMKEKSIWIDPSNIKEKFHFLGQVQPVIDHFIDEMIYPSLSVFKRDISPRILNRPLRKEDFGLDQTYVTALVCEATPMDNNIAMKSFHTPL